MSLRIAYEGKHRPVLVGSTMTFDALPKDAWDSQQFRVYASEWSIAKGQAFDRLQDVAEFVDRVVGSSFWHQHFGFIETVTVERNPDPDWSTGHRELLATTGTIQIADAHLNELVVLHELAHVASPLFTGPASYHRGGLPEWSRRRTAGGHDGYFTGLNALLVSQFISDRHAGLLHDAYTHFGVPMGEDVLESVKHSRWSIEPRAAEWAKTLDTMEAENRASRAAQGNPEPVPPQPWWGSWLWEYRKLLYAQSQRALATDLSKFERCSPSDVRAIERSKEFPTDSRLLRLAMMAGVYYGVDPIWMRTALGLTRWETGVPMGVLVKVNPNWVRFVRQLNRALKERPPLWVDSAHQ